MSSNAIHPSGGNRQVQSESRSGASAWLDGPMGAIVDAFVANPWGAHAGDHRLTQRSLKSARGVRPLYTPAERERRDSTVWTLVQGILAPVQFLAFGVSVVLVLRYLLTGEGAQAATLSVLVKTGLLYLIMVTGAVWEKVVFGRFLFAPAFFWEDVFSMGVLALHTAYLAAVLSHWGTPGQQMAIALAGYAAYVVNAAQFVWKLRQARLEGDRAPVGQTSQGLPA